MATNNANYLSQAQCKAVNISRPFRHTSVFFFFLPFAINILSPWGDAFNILCAPAYCARGIPGCHYKEAWRRYHCSTACDASLEMAWSNNSKCQQGAVLIIWNVPHKRNQLLLLQHEYYLKQEGYSSCYHNLCVINFPCLEKEINNPVNCYSK